MCTDIRGVSRPEGTTKAAKIEKCPPMGHMDQLVAHRVAEVLGGPCGQYTTGIQRRSIDSCSKSAGINYSIVAKLSFSNSSRSVKMMTCCYHKNSQREEKSPHGTHGPTRCTPNRRGVGGSHCQYTTGIRNRSIDSCSKSVGVNYSILVELRSSNARKPEK